MSPATLLHLWRDRWHKPQYPDHSVPMVHGRISRWAMDLARSNNWGVPGLSAFMLWAGLATLLTATTIRLTTNSQIVLGWTLVGFAIYLRRHRGQVFALAIVGLAAFLGLRYFFWRVDATMPTHAFSSIALAWILVVVELALWLRTGLDYVATIWPMEQESTPLPDDAVTWPTVDIVLLAGTASADAISHLVANSLTMDWPQNKYRTFVLATHHSPEVEAACTSAHVLYRVYQECHAQDSAALLNRALYESDADMLVVASCEQPLAPDLLRQTIGWFVQEPALALVQSPWSPLAPAPQSDRLAHLGSLQKPPCWAVVRRSSVLEVGGFSTAPANTHLHTARLLERAGFFDAYLAARPREGQALQYTRLDGPFRTRSLPLRIQLDRLRTGLHFYAPLTSTVMMGIPIAVLLGSTMPIATDIFTLSAYWLPQWILGRLALATALEHRRLRWWDFVKEELGGFAVLLRTSKSFCTTWLRHITQRRSRLPVQSGNHLSPPSPTTFRPSLIAGFLVFGGVTVYGAYRAYAGTTVPLAEIYLLWALFWALSFLSELAVQRELDWVQAHRLACEHQPCMVTPPTRGRPLRATTSNFPQLPLVLALSPNHELTVGQSLYVSMFLGHREYVFPCQVSAHRTEQIEVQVAQAHLAEFRQFAAFVFTRPTNWPLWLPPSHADRLLPGWMYRLLMRLQDAFYNLAVKSTAPAVFQRIRARLFPGNSTHG